MHGHKSVYNTSHICIYKTSLWPSHRDMYERRPNLLTLHKAPHHLVWPWYSASTSVLLSVWSSLRRCPDYAHQGLVHVRYRADHWWRLQCLPRLEQPYELFYQTDMYHVESVRWHFYYCEEEEAYSTESNNQRKNVMMRMMMIIIIIIKAERTQGSTTII